MDSSDLIGKLRSRKGEAITRVERLMDEAASHIEAQDKLIERLTVALEKIKDMPSVYGTEEVVRQQSEGRLNEQCRWIARDALSPSGEK